MPHMNWAADGTPIHRPDLAQRREMAARLFRTIAGSDTVDGFRVLTAPARCNTCWDGSTMAVTTTTDLHNTVHTLCMLHTRDRVTSTECLTCDRCATTFRDARSNMATWVRMGQFQGGVYGSSMCRPCQREYRQCSECPTRYHYTEQVQCCPVPIRCSLCNIRLIDGLEFAENVEIASRYDYQGTETLAHVCADCETTGLRTCVECERLCRRSDTYSVNGSDILSVCTADLNGYRPETQYNWSVCGRHGYAWRVDVDELECCNPYSTIHSYSYKPNPIFRGEGPAFYGAEIEICAPDHDSAASIAGRGFKGLVYLKEDGSIRDGFEMVTHPMSYGYWMNEFPWQTLTELRQAGAYEHSSCGIHVHAARAGFSGAAHEHRWLTFFDNNQTAIEKIARRSGSSYARFGTLTARDKKIIATCKPGRPGHFQRYSAVNVNNTNTYEVRIFATSIDPDVVKAAVGFVSATVEYTRQLKARDVLKSAGMSWTAFRTWVESRPEYAPLYAEMNRVNA